MDRSRTKLVCTIGPASFERVGDLVAAGMDVARINFSHGTPDDHKAYVHAVRAAAHSARRSVAVMVDLPGPKIRLGELEGGAITLVTGATFTLRPASQANAAAAEVVPVATDVVLEPNAATEMTPADTASDADGPADTATDMSVPTDSDANGHAPAATDMTPADAATHATTPPDAATHPTTPPDAATHATAAPYAAGEMTVTPEAADDSAETTEESTATTVTPYADDTTAELVETDAVSRAPDEGDDTTGSAMAVSEPAAAPEALGDASGARVSTPGLAAQLEVGDRVLLADGAAELRVTAISGSAVETEVVHGGMVRSRSGVNIPSSRLTGDGLTDDDRAAVPRALEVRADLIAQSFVRSADDVRALRSMLPADGPRVVAKIETRAAIDNFDEIAQVADGIMVARGDLGVDIPFEDVPLVQKDLIQAAAAANKFSIVATQMLESMTGAVRPTRAEASDVANAVLDGADAVMLSAETAIGAYPVEALQAMARICLATERAPGVNSVSARDSQTATAAPAAPAAREAPVTLATAVILAATATTSFTDVGAIWCFTRTGHTAEKLSLTRPGVPIVAFTLSPIVARRLAVRRGVIPMILPTAGKTETLMERMEGAWRSQRDRAAFETVILVTTSQQPAGINRMEVHRLTGNTAAKS